MRLSLRLRLAACGLQRLPRQQGADRAAELADALYFGHDGNHGDPLLGAGLGCRGAASLSPGAMERWHPDHLGNHH
jgi:hypothetical protein